MSHQDQLRKALLDNYIKQQQLAHGIPASSRLPPVPPPMYPTPDVRVPETRQPDVRHRTPESVRPPPVPQPPAPPAAVAAKQELVLVENVDENITLEQFKEFVRKWIELDNFIKVNAESLRQKKKVRDKLALVISKFMCKYNIEDLNTKEGKIRCKVRAVKPPVTQNTVKQKLNEIFAHDEKKKEEVIEKIYKEERPKVEKVSLRRLKISSA